MLNIYSKSENMVKFVTGDGAYFLYDQVEEGKEWKFDHEDIPRTSKLKRFTTTRKEIKNRKITIQCE